jgi:hypothetical protein
MKTAPFLGGGRAGRDNGWSSWYYYTAFYASLAIYQYGGDEWEKWYPGIREELLKKQDATGKWPESYGVLDTAFATLVLEFPYRLLPMFQDGGRGAEGRYNIGGK